MEKPLYNINLTQWMSELPYKLRHTPLVSLAIPGSHDSGSYCLHINGGVAPDQVAATSLPIIRRCPKLITPIIRRWSKTQKIDITSQLEHGIRYFDMRVAYKLGANDFYFVHGLYGDKVLEMCRQINEFLKINPKEVVLIDFQHFYDMTFDQMDGFYQEVELIFGGRICPFPGGTNVKDLTLSNLWDQGKQVIICFRCNRICKQYSNCWPSECFANPWANTRHGCELIPFLSDMLSERMTDCFFVAQGVLTPDSSYVLWHFYRSLRSKLAISCNRKLDDWLQLVKVQQGNLNIVMSDFVEWNNFALPRRTIFHNYNYIV